MRSLRTFGGKSKVEAGSGEVALPITSLADVFTILLVFLIKSSASGSMSVAPSAGLQLPIAEAGQQPIEALKLEIGQKGINVEGQPVVELNGFKFPDRDLQGGVSQLLSQAIQKYRERQQWIAKGNTDVKADSKVILIADQNAPYRAIKSVLASAAVQGYTDFKLVVVNRSQ